MTPLRRGDVFRLPPPRRARGHEQRGARPVVIVQSEDLLGLSTVLVAPTSTSARAAPWRPQVHIDGLPTLVMVEQTRVVDAGLALRARTGGLDASELAAVDDALRLVLGL